MKPWQHIAIGLFMGFLLAGLLLLLLLPNQGTPLVLVTKTPDLTPLATNTPDIIRVHVSGAVKQPGLVTLPKNACLADAIQAAGGLVEGYDENLLNLSELLMDGSRIHIPKRDEATVTLQAPSRSQSGFSFAENTQININTADFETLCLLPGIGPSKAQAIIEYREKNGLFLKLEDLQKVKGIGPTIFNSIKDRITLDDQE